MFSCQIILVTAIATKSITFNILEKKSTTGAYTRCKFSNQIGYEALNCF
jgi:hypothetical protein